MELKGMEYVQDIVVNKRLPIVMFCDEQVGGTVKIQILDKEEFIFIQKWIERKQRKGKTNGSIKDNI